MMKKVEVYPSTLFFSLRCKLLLVFVPPKNEAPGGGEGNGMTYLDRTANLAI